MKKSLITSALLPLMGALLVCSSWAGELTPSAPQVHTNESLQEIIIHELSLVFSNPAYTYEIHYQSGQYLIDAYFTPDGHATLDDYEFWQPPDRKSPIRLAQSKTNSNGIYLEFDVGEPRSIKRHQALLGGNDVTWYQQGYAIFIPHDRTASGDVFRFQRNLTTGAVTKDEVIPGGRSVFFGDERMRIGRVSKADVSFEYRFFLPPPANPLPIPLLQVLLSTNDLATLYELQRLTTVDQMKSFLAHQYQRTSKAKLQTPSLRFDTLPLSDPSQGKFRPAYQSPDGPEPVIFLRERSTRGELLHETVHFLIDRARLEQWPDQTLRLRRSYITWKKRQLAQLAEDLDRAIKTQNSAEESVLRAEMIFNLIEDALNEDGQEVEVILLLLQNRERLGLGTGELIKQFETLHQNFGSLVEKVANLMLAAERHLKPSGPITSRQSERLQHLRTQVNMIYIRLNEISTYMTDPACTVFL